MTDHTNGNRLDSVRGLELSRRQVLQISGLSLGAMILAACSKSGDVSPSGSPTGAPKSGGTLKVSMSDASSTEVLDPAVALATNDVTYCSQIWESLTQVDEDNTAHPLLAASWTADSTAKTWTFKLQQGVTFHDGTPLTSKDVVYSAQRWLNKDLGSSIFAFLDGYLTKAGVIAQGDDTVVFNLEKPNSLFPLILGFQTAKITKAGQDTFTLATAIGTGPFKLTSWTPATSWSVVKNPTYWQKGLPYLDGINAVVVPDQSTKVQGALSGSTDVASSIPVTLWTTFAGKSNVSLVKLDNKQNWTFAFDQRKAPFNDQRVLDALKLATDRDTILKTALQGNGTISADIPVWATSQFYPTDVKPEYNPDKAKALLAQAGFANGLDIELNTSGGIAGMLDMGTAWAQVVKSSGINVTLKQWPESSYWNKAWMQTAAFQDYWTRQHPALALSAFYQSSGPWDEAQHTDPKVDALLEQFYATPDEAQSRALMQQALTQARSSFSYVIPVFQPTGWAVSSKVTGVSLDPINYVNFTKASFV